MDKLLESLASLGDSCCARMCLPLSACVHLCNGITTPAASRHQFFGGMLDDSYAEEEMLTLSHYQATRVINKQRVLKGAL